MPVRTLSGLDVKGRRVLLRADLNVPVHDGRITDLTRIERLTPTIRELADKGAKVIVCSHFERPKGKRVPEMSLAPVARALGDVLGRKVRFAEDCVGTAAEQAVERLNNGEILVLENTRFHVGEEKNDPDFAQGLARLADIYVNDAFSAAHRAHASTEGVDVLVIGGAMANTFLAAQGVTVGKSLQEPDMHQTARDILTRAEQERCEIILPMDAVVAAELKPNPETRTVAVGAIPADMMV